MTVADAPRQGVAEALAWLEERRRASGLAVERVPLPECEEWHLDDGELRHASGRYFQIVGSEVDSGPYAGWDRPMIRQHEIGLLGFLVTRREGDVDLLVQAKTEPGNVGGTQLAPTVQATASNQDRVHGGLATRHLERFAEGVGTTRSDALASEQGSRFLGKRNRNKVVELPTDASPAASDAWSWLDRAALRDLLAHDYAVNTDARSVIASGPWELIADGDEPFARHEEGTFGHRLRASYLAAGRPEGVLTELERRRAATEPSTRETPLRLDDDSLAFVRVSVRGREIDRWCQPLLASELVGRCDLHTQVRDGQLRFLFAYRHEPGLRGLVELGPTVQVEDEATGGTDEPDDAQVRLSLLQSDEGSRFMTTVTRYRVLELGPGDSEPTVDGAWLTAGEVEALARAPGTMTNEARSLVSLLLSLA